MKHSTTLAATLLLFVASASRAADFRIDNYGAIGDGATLGTSSIQAAIDAAEKSPDGGTVVIPGGRFLSGAIFLKPRVQLRLEKDAVLLGSTNIGHYPLMPTRIEGATNLWRPALVNAERCDGLRIDGEGRIQGGGKPFWDAFTSRFKADNATRNLDVHRPRNLFIQDSKDVVVSGISLRDSGFWNLHLYRCQNVTIEGVDIRTPPGAPSTDGIDVDSCQDVTIRKCYISVDDDSIALKGTKGPLADQDAASPAVERIHIVDCTFAHGHSMLTLGSEASHVKGVRLERCKVIAPSDVPKGARSPTLLTLKLRPDTPQRYEDIHIRDVSFETGGSLFNVAAWRQYFDLKGHAAPKQVVENVVVENISGTLNTFGRIDPPDGATVRNVTMRNVDVTFKRDAKVTIRRVDGLRTENVKFNGQLFGTTPKSPEVAPAAPAKASAAPTTIPVAAMVYPARDEKFTRSLNGDWSFKYVAGNDAGTDAGFTLPAADVSSWKTIAVPSNWELQGFADPKYAMELQDGLGLYRRPLRLPADWRADGRRVLMRFEGVAFGFEAWVNETLVGRSSASAYNPHTFDVTDALRDDAENVVAVRVWTKPLGFEFDVNDDWALSGIFRDVTVFSVPAVHVRDVTTKTTLKADGAASLSVSIAMSHPDAEVRAKLLAPSGEAVADVPLTPQVDGRCGATIEVVRPQLWTAETPSLYRLQVTLSSAGKPIQTIEERVGLREVSIVDGVLRLNGRPIKLRGVNHHDLDPENGRAITEAQMRRDLELMQRANINFVRTSHYPASPRFIELCDEMGIYVMSEVSIGKGEEHLNDPAYRENILARVAPTIVRDKNRPSVIAWSIGNENPITDVEQAAGRLAKELDPTRPICFPKTPTEYSKHLAEIEAYSDITSPHYPTNGELRAFAETVTQPLILTEYAHALGLASERIEDQWEILQSTPRFAGGAIWHFMDQGLLRRSPKPIDQSKPTKSAWIDATRLYDTHEDDGMDGIVYADRTPQSDFWEVRQVYSPVQIAERATTVRTGRQQITLTVENRYDFRSLDGMKLAWSLRRNGVALGSGEAPLRAASRERERIQIDVNVPDDAGADVLTLVANCLNERGQSITDRALRLNVDSAKRAVWLDSLKLSGRLRVSETTGSVTVEHERWTLNVTRNEGKLTLSDRAGNVLIAGLVPHAGRRMTLAERYTSRSTGTWRVVKLDAPIAPEMSMERQGDAVRLSVSGRYARPDARDQAFVGGYVVEVSAKGAIAIRYDFVPTNAKGAVSEAGLSLVLPPRLTEFRWIGRGIFAGYPGKDRLNGFGLFHLNREDLRFQGNRRETEFAMVTTADGAGVAMATDATDVAVERDGDATLLKHNAAIGSLGNKGWAPETIVELAKTPRVAGSFTLVPLGDDWPAPLTRWFGKPSAANDVFRPFYHSYDQ